MVIRRRGFTGIGLGIGELEICVDPGVDFEKCSVVLCTHDHTRHCDISLLDGEKKTYYSPISGIVVKHGDEFNVGKVSVRVIHAYNRPETRGGITPHPRGLGVGYIIDPGYDTRVFYMGDTDFIDEVLELSRSIAILIPPIGGGCVMNPEEAVEVVKSIKPAITIPVHYVDIRDYYKFRDMAQMYTQVIRLS